MMTREVRYDPQKHHRQSIRLKGYDYAQPGAYFITIVTFQPELSFGNIVNSEMQIYDYGSIADEYWRAIPIIFPMPNHVHGIIVIRSDENRMANVKPGSLGAIVRSFKSAVSRRIGREWNTRGIWQRNYHEHIIRNPAEWDRIHRYIESNPSRWAEDAENK